ncbi:uncharacterized protein LOC113859844 [Abrus precatorius]|uniref:Uncharacterized protein LOC113859844 n=1 Tax=Abrus precatorius TaxID=3816 RepID=A0A8B8KY74_ABRPR|nr:uncharacterized protein LOC113859844 [Abrus precatorius]
MQWIPPLNNQLKLNVNGAVSKSSGVAAYRGLIRDSLGKFIIGFYFRLNSCSPLSVKLWDLCMGLHLVMLKNIQSILIESDSKFAINLILHIQSSSHPLFTLICNIRESLRKVQFVRFSHICREVNHCVDSLVKMSLDLLSPSCWLDIPPSSLVFL